MPPLSTASKVKKSNQFKITGFSSRPITNAKQEKLDDQILRIIVKDDLPFSIVESVEFRKFISILNPSYEPPSRETLSNSLISKLYDVTLLVVQNDVSGASYVNLTTDGWTSLKNENYFAVTAHFIDKNCHMKSYLLSCLKFTGKHTSENIADALKTIVSQWGLQDKIVACTTDNAANMVRAVKLCQWLHIPCFTHSLNWLFKRAGRQFHRHEKKLKLSLSFLKEAHKLSKSFIASRDRWIFPT